MKTTQELTELVRESLSGGTVGQFRPCAFFDDRLDCIRVIARECSVVETRVNGLLTILEANYPRGDRECAGFTIKGARYFCQKYGLSLATPIKISDLLDAVLQAAPDVVVRTIIDHVARPLVKEARIEQVEPADVSGTVPQEAP